MFAYEWVCCEQVPIQQLRRTTCLLKDRVYIKFRKNLKIGVCQFHIDKCWGEI